MQNLESESVKDRRFAASLKSYLSRWTIMSRYCVIVAKLNRTWYRLKFIIHSNHLFLKILQNKGINIGSWSCHLILKSKIWRSFFRRHVHFQSFLEEVWNINLFCVWIVPILLDIKPSVQLVLNSLQSFNWFVFKQ